MPETTPRPETLNFHEEPHLISRQGWLRAAMMGANDGILSTSALLLGVAAGGFGTQGIVIAGISAAAAGAMSMAAGEYVSVASQADLENADIARERRSLKEYPAEELEELTHIYMERGLERPLAAEVARALTERDALGTHLRDELGMAEVTRARPLQAALASAVAFTTGAIPPILVAAFSPEHTIYWTVGAITVIALAILGALGARAGGARPVIAAIRVAFWGVAAMAVSSGIGALVGAAV